MIVCVCRAVSDRTIRTAIAEGAKTVQQVSQTCRAGDACGACCPTISRMMAEAGGRGDLCRGCPSAPTQR